MNFLRNSIIFMFESVSSYPQYSINSKVFQLSPPSPTCQTVFWRALLLTPLLSIYSPFQYNVCACLFFSFVKYIWRKLYVQGGRRRMGWATVRPRPLELRLFESCASWRHHRSAFLILKRKRLLLLLVPGRFTWKKNKEKLYFYILFILFVQFILQ